MAKANANANANADLCFLVHYDYIIVFWELLRLFKAGRETCREMKLFVNYYFIKL